MYYDKGVLRMFPACKHLYPRCVAMFQVQMYMWNAGLAELRVAHVHVHICQVHALTFAGSHLPDVDLPYSQPTQRPSRNPSPRSYPLNPNTLRSRNPRVHLNQGPVFSNTSRSALTHYEITTLTHIMHHGSI